MKFRKPGDDIILTKELAEMRDELTAKQIEFCHHLVAQENRKTATECAVMAGYSEHSARIPDLKTALAAEISRGKAAGYYEKKDKVKDKSIDSLSLEEVSEMLSKMKKTVIIEGTPADLEDNGPKTVQSDDQSEQSDQQVP